MVKWANDGLLQANDGKMLVNDGEMLVNDGEMSVWSYTHFTIINEHFTIINEHFTIINEHFTVISLKYTIICSFDHHGEAEVTQVKVMGTFFFIQILFFHLNKIKRLKEEFVSNILSVFISLISLKMFKSPIFFIWGKWPVYVCMY